MSGGNFPRRPLSIACPRGPEARLLQRLQSLGDFGCAGQRDEGFASSSCRWTLGATSNGNLVPVVALSEPSAFCTCSCACACANLIVDILASGPRTASAPRLWWTFRAACRIRSMCTVAPRTMYAQEQEHAALAGCRLRTRPCMSKAVDGHNSLRGGCAPSRTFPPLCEDLNRAHRPRWTEQGHGARTGRQA